MPRNCVWKAPPLTEWEWIQKFHFSFKRILLQVFVLLGFSMPAVGTKQALSERPINVR
jgi:hypothetical protein